MSVEHVSNISATVSKAQLPSASSQSVNSADNKESTDSKKKKMMKYAVGATALAAVILGGYFYLRKGKAKGAIDDLSKKGQQTVEDLTQNTKKTIQEAEENITEIPNGTISGSGAKKTEETLSEAEIIDRDIKIEKRKEYKTNNKKLENDFGLNPEGLKLDSQGSALPKYIDMETMEGERILKDGKLEKIIQKNDNGVVTMELFPADGPMGCRHIFHNDPVTGKCTKELWYFDNGKTLHNVRILDNDKPVKIIAYFDDGITLRGETNYKNGFMVKDTTYYEDGKSFQQIREFAEKENQMLLREVKYKRADNASVKESEAIFDSSRGRFIRRDYFGDDGVTIVRTEA